ncbi:unnamed protein product [Caenorhabditis nigoni]
MLPNLEKVTKMIEKLSIKPVYDTNWCDMPKNVKLLCIDSMELKPRLSMRCTAKAERSLVDSQKFAFYEAHFMGGPDNQILELHPEDGRKYSKMFGNPTEAFKLMKFIWKIGVFKNLYISLKGPAAKKEVKGYDGLFKAEKVNFDGSDNEIVATVLRKMKQGVESIMIEANEPKDFPFDQILEMSPVHNSRYWHVQNYEETDSLYKVAQIWIDKSSKIGSTFQVAIYNDGSFDKFLEHLDDRIVSKNEKRARIRTNKPDRHILLERGLDEVVGIDDFPQYFRLKVISARTKESEYDDGCKEWISKIDSECYEESDSEDFFSFERIANSHGFYHHYDDDKYFRDYGVIIEHRRDDDLN